VKQHSWSGLVNTTAHLSLSVSHAKRHRSRFSAITLSLRAEGVTRYCVGDGAGGRRGVRAGD